MGDTALVAGEADRFDEMTERKGLRMHKPWETDLHIYNDENALLEGLRCGDRLACTCLLKRYAPRLYRLAQQMMGDPEEAEEVLQEAFIAACGRIATFEGKSGLGTWLHRIAVNTALMRLRRRQPEVTSLSVTEQPSRSLHEPEAVALAGEMQRDITAAVQALPATLRTAVVLRKIEGFSTSETAQMLDISETALKVRLHRARQVLRDTLAHYMSPPLQDMTDAQKQRLIDAMCDRPETPAGTTQDTAR